MKIIILEGIASSGKTTVKNNLLSKFKKDKISCEVIGEEKTLMPILENTDRDISLNFLSNVLEKVLNQDKNVIIFDRLFFTHIFRTASKLSDFKNIENILLKHRVLLILLVIQEEKIAERIFGAMKHRDKKWEEYIRKKGNDKEIVDYYKKQQQFLLKLTKQSNIPHIIEDSTDLNFERIQKTILKKMSKDD